MFKRYISLLLTLLLVLPATGVSAASDLGLNAHKEATSYTQEANEQFYALLDFEDETENATIHQ